jgi:hypothetical protein
MANIAEGWVEFFSDLPAPIPALKRLLDDYPL